MKILVTGGSGFIGTNLIDSFRDIASVINLDNMPPRKSDHLEYWREVDLLDRAALSLALKDERPDYVIHMGARTDLDSDNIDEYAVNVEGTKNLLSIIENFDFSVKKVIIFSSKFVNRNNISTVDPYCCRPHTTYGLSKLQMEKLICEGNFSFEWIIVRPTSIWGPYFSVPYKNFFSHIQRGTYFHIGGSPVKKTYGYVGNTCFQVHQLLFRSTTEMKNRILYLGDEPEYVLQEWANEIAVEFDRTLISIPLPIVKFIAYLGDFFNILGVSFPLTTFRFLNMTENGINDVGATIEFTGEGPFSRLDGTRLTVEWMKGQL